MKGRKKQPEYDACRSFFIYADGRLFIQKVNYSKPFARIGQPLVINMKGAMICGNMLKTKEQDLFYPIGQFTERKE